MKRNVWKCDICGKEGFWSDTWQWFGSYKDLEDKGRQAIKVACSDVCCHKLEPL